MKNPLTWIREKFKTSKTIDLSTFAKELLNMCSNVLNDKYYFVKECRYINVKLGYVIKITFDPRTSIIPVKLQNAHENNRNGTSPLSLFIIIHNKDTNALLKAILDIYVWACNIPAKGTPEYIRLLKEAKENVCSN